MNLVTDIGNSRTKIFVFEQSSIKHKQIVETISENVLQNILDTFTISKAILSSVTNQEAAIYNYLLKKNIPTHIISETSNHKLTIRYKTPNTLGKDRLAAAIGAASLFPKSNKVIIDAGTAITIDMVTDKNEYLGGNISPGVNTRFKALHNYTNKLPLLSVKNSWSIIGNNTDSAIISGVQQGVIFEIEGYINYFKKNFKNVQIIITGGDADFISTNISHQVCNEPDLVLIGLNSIIQYNV